jgi:S1-C subfamily serine protease/HEAT repeat protein
MTRRFATAAVCLVIVLVGFGAQADTALPIKTLTEIKDATVFVRVEKDSLAVSGTGFIVRTEGDVAYVVTNDHVVRLTTQVERRILVGGSKTIGPKTIGPKMIGPKIGPKVPVVPKVPRPSLDSGATYRTVIVEVTVPNPSYTVVLNSGTRNERIVTGELVGSDRELDLAVLRLSGVKSLPKPLAQESPDLVETMQVFTFGFPFGKALALDKGNPAITVGRASVSSIRTRKSGDVGIVQLEGSVNPGNSGGPVVDEKGRLVGIVVAKIKDTQIGLAIPAGDLRRLMQGRVGDAHFTAERNEKTSVVDVATDVSLIDPFEKIKTISLHYAPAAAVTDQVKKQGLAKLAESKKVELRSERARAAGRFTLEGVEGGEYQLAYQLAYGNGDGKAVLGEVKVSTLHVTEPSPSTKIDPPKNTTPNPPKTDPSKTNPAINPPVANLKLLTEAELNQVIDAIKSPSPFKYDNAYKKLENSAPDPKRQAEVAKLLEAGLDDRKRAVRCALALGSWGTEESIPLLIRHIGNPSVRGPVIDSLGKLRAVKAIDPLMESFLDFVYHRKAHEALVRIGPAAESAVVAKALAHKDVSIRVKACKLLQEIGTQASIAPLEAARKENNLNRPAEEALAAIQARGK